MCDPSFFSLLSECLSLGDSTLDGVLRGGIGEGITELVGEAACGKTQIAMQLLLQVHNQHQPAGKRKQECAYRHDTSNKRLTLTHLLSSSSPLVQSQLPVSSGGLGGGALFLAMEGDFPTNRLNTMADAFKKRHPEIKHRLLDKILIKQINVRIRAENNWLDQQLSELKPSSDQFYMRSSLSFPRLRMSCVLSCSMTFA